MGLKKERLLDKINNFFVRNWFLNGISNIIIILLFGYFFMELDNVKKDFTQKLQKAMQNIVVATPDGRVGLLKKTFVNTDSDYFKNSIAIVSKNLVASESILTQGFNAAVSSQIKKPADLLKTNENFALLYKEYFANKHITVSFLRYYYNLLKLRELPAKVSILSTSYEYKPLGNNRFAMTITFKTAKDFINKVSNKVAELVVDDIFVVEGFIDPTNYSTALNPYGVKFTNIKMKLFTYSDYAKREVR